MKKILLLVCVLISFQTFAQHDWTEGKLYLKKGIVKHGLIMFPRLTKDLLSSNGKQKVKFRANKTATQEKYDYKQVDKIEFIHTDTKIDIYEYIQVSKKKHQLFKRVISGKATLYARIVTKSSTVDTHGAFMPPTVVTDEYDEFYVRRKGEKIASPLVTARISRSFRKRAMEYFSDCPKLVKKLKKRMYKGRHVEYVVKLYNNCH